MNILWQNEHYPDVVKGGGGAVNTRYIVRALNGLGHRTVILARGSTGGGVTSEDSEAGQIIRLPRPSVPRSLWPLWPLLEPRLLHSALRRLTEPFDAFVCIDPAYAFAIKRLHPTRPLIHRIETTQKGHVLPRSARPRTPRKLKEAVLMELLQRIDDHQERRAWSVADRLVVKSEFMRRDLCELYGLTPAKIRVIPNGVDLVRFADASQRVAMRASLVGPADNSVVIVFAGRLVPLKNVPFLLQAAALMCWRERCRIVLLGDGVEREFLAAEADRLGLSSRVTFLGNRDNVHDYFAAADIFVLPSTYETFGNALVEAMAAGLPIVALRPDSTTVRTATAEIVVDGDSALLVDPRDPSNLSEALDRLVADADLRRRMGGRAQEVCRQRSDWRACASSYAVLLGAHAGVPADAAAITTLATRPGALASAAVSGPSPKVSVVIPTYNCRALLIETLESVLQQSFRDYEVIVVDDGSTDGTREAMKRWQDRVVYLYQPHTGIAATARNRGIAAARGEWIAFTDSDDLWDSDKLRRQIALLEAEADVDVCFTGHTTFGAVQDDSPLVHARRVLPRLAARHLPPDGYLFTSPSVLEDHLVRGPLPFWTSSMVVRRHCFSTVGLFDDHSPLDDDTQMWLRLAKRCRVAYIDAPLARRRIRPGSLTANTDPYQSYRGSVRTLETLDQWMSLSRAEQAGIADHLARLRFALGYEHFSRNELRPAWREFQASLRHRPSSKAARYLALASLPSPIVKALRRLKRDVLAASGPSRTATPEIRR